MTVKSRLLRQRDSGEAVVFRDDAIVGGFSRHPANEHLIGQEVLVYMKAIDLRSVRACLTARNWVSSMCRGSGR